MKTTKWKLALLAWSAMFPFSTAVSYGLSEWPLTAHLPLVGRTFCLTCALIPYMIFGVLPFVTRRFKTWLQAAENQAGNPLPGAEGAPDAPPAEPGGLSVSRSTNGDGLRAETTPVLQGIAA